MVTFGKPNQVFQVHKWVKNSPAKQEMWVGSLGQEDPLEEGMATHSRILFLGESSGQRNLAGYSPLGHKESDLTEASEHSQVVRGLELLGSVLPPASRWREGLEVELIAIDQLFNGSCP